MFKQIILICLTFMILLASAKSLNEVRWQPLPGTVALIFDNGPSPIYTPQILKILKQYKVAATFFVMGWLAKKYLGLLKQMIAAGHAVAIHTMSHLDSTTLSQHQLYYEVVEPKKIVAKIIGKPPVCLRPPFGRKNKRVERFVNSQNMVLVPMGFNSFDYQQPGVAKIVQWLVSNAKSRRVVLLHDGYKARSQTVKALPAIIKGIRKRGLEFSAICYP